MPKEPKTNRLHKSISPFASSSENVKQELPVVFSSDSYQEDTLYNYKTVFNDGHVAEQNDLPSIDNACFFICLEQFFQCNSIVSDYIKERATVRQMRDLVNFFEIRELNTEDDEDRIKQLTSYFNSNIYIYAQLTDSTGKKYIDINHMVPFTVKNPFYKIAIICTYDAVEDIGHFELIYSKTHYTEEIVFIPLTKSITGTSICILNNDEKKRVENHVPDEKLSITMDNEIVEIRKHLGYYSRVIEEIFDIELITKIHDLITDLKKILKKGNDIKTYLNGSKIMETIKIEFDFYYIMKNEITKKIENYMDPINKAMDKTNQ